jgi:hypothetical protein
MAVSIRSEKMFSQEESWARMPVTYMNVELNRVELELSRVEFRLRSLLQSFSIEDIVRHARRDLVRKSVDKLKSLASYYSMLSRPAGNGGSTPQGDTPSRLSEEQVLEAVVCVSEYLQERRDSYFPAGAPLSDHHRSTMERFFKRELLRKVRVVQAQGRQIPEPPFYARARAMGIQNLPPLSHLASLTIVDVLVFTGPINERDLFHALVHAAQFESLGLARYADLYVRSFLHFSRAFLIPLEIQSFALDTRFATNPEEVFDVEDEIRNWARDGRYGVASAAERGAL